MRLWGAAERRRLDLGWVQVITLALTEMTSYGVLSSRLPSSLRPWKESWDGHGPP